MDAGSLKIDQKSKEEYKGESEETTTSVADTFVITSRVATGVYRDSNRGTILVLNEQERIKNIETRLGKLEKFKDHIYWTIGVIIVIIAIICFLIAIRLIELNILPTN